MHAEVDQWVYSMLKIHWEVGEKCRQETDGVGRVRIGASEKEGRKERGKCGIQEHAARQRIPDRARLDADSNALYGSLFWLLYCNTRAIFTTSVLPVLFYFISFSDSDCSHAAAGAGPYHNRLIRGKTMQ